MARRRSVEVGVKGECVGGGARVVVVRGVSGIGVEEEAMGSPFVRRVTGMVGVVMLLSGLLIKASRIGVVIGNMAEVKVNTGQLPCCYLFLARDLDEMTYECLATP